MLARLGPASQASITDRNSLLIVCSLLLAKLPGPPIARRMPVHEMANANT
jgi:hypothetical protein